MLGLVESTGYPVITIPLRWANGRLAIIGRTGVLPVHFPFFAARRSRLDFGFGPFAGRSDANPPAFGAIPQHLPVVEYFIPFRL